MLKPLQNSQRAQPLSTTEKKVEKKNESATGQNTVAGQELASPLSDFLNEAEMNAINPDEAQPTELAEQGEQAEALVEITEEMEASASQIDQEELVAELLETIPELQIYEEQLDVFVPLPSDVVDESDSGMQNLIEAVVETMAETSAEILVSTFVQSEDIAKLVSSKTTVWSHVGQKLVEKTIMLLTNGMAYTDLKTPPGQLELPSSTESIVGSAWTTWRQDEETGAIYLGSDENSGVEERLVGAEIDISPLSIEDIAGTHTKVQANSWSSTRETRWSDIVFHEDGVFEYAETKVSTTGGYDTLWMESFSQSAIYVSANRPISNADGTVVEAKGTPNTSMFGSFQLAEDGLSINLTYADGTEESRLIYKNDGYVHFGSSSFKTRHESKAELTRLRDMLLSGNGRNYSKAEWFSVLADSTAAANRNREHLNELFRPLRNSSVRD